MDRSLIRTPKGWASFDFFAIVISVLLLILLIILWLMGAGLGNENCCKKEESAPAPVVQEEVVEAEPVIVVEPLPYSIEFSHSASTTNNYAKITGTVANSETRARLLEKVQKAFNAGQVQENVKVEENTVPLATISNGEALGPFFDLFNKLSDMAISLKDGKLGIDPQNIRLSGTAIDKQSADEMLKLLDGIDLGGRELSTNVSFVPPPKPEVKKVDCRAVLKASQVEFATGSAELTSTGKESLNIAFKCLSAGRYSVIGHTDNTGNTDLNEKLSLERANSAMSYLISLGVDRDRLVAKGKGESEPVATNSTAEGRAQNRRIEFRLR